MTTKRKIMRYASVIHALITGTAQVPDFEPEKIHYESAFWHIKKAHAILTGLEPPKQEEI